MGTVKPIAFYLPQFHTIPENDSWWGEGFTEWTNVKKAQPVFEDHYQPHIPLDRNYYDLNDHNVLIKQTKLAEKYGIYGFCFYHYWFNTKLLLEKPLQNLLASSEPKMPFCLCWANENWTKRWDGFENEIIMRQDYSNEDDLKHIQYLIQFFKDDRYIKVDGKPVFLVYRAELHPDMNSAVKIWTDEVKKEGFTGLFLINVENFQRNVPPQNYSFDAGLEFAPDISLGVQKYFNKDLRYYLKKLLHYSRLKSDPRFNHKIVSYRDVVDKMLKRPLPGYPYYRCIAPSWDNSARRKRNATIYAGSSPAVFGHWASETARYTQQKFPAEKQFLFINAWNEWAEGCHLEPDEKFQYLYLEELKKAIESFDR